MLDSVIFTVPSESIRKIKDFDSFVRTYNIIIDSISKFLSYKPERPYRVVFDIDKPDDGPDSSDYPLVFSTSTVDDAIVNFDIPTPGMFHIVASMARVSLREGCFEDIQEIALSYLTATAALECLFDGFNIDSIDVDPPLLFHEFWFIYRKFDKDLIPVSLGKFQSEEYPLGTVPEDTWIAFVWELSCNANTNFTQLFEKSSPIPLNASLQLSNLSDVSLLMEPE